MKEEAINKIKDLVTDIETCMMVTNLNHQPLSAIPMHSKKVDDLGNIWFLSSSTSDHNTDILKDSSCQLLYSDPSDKAFLSVYGSAFISNDEDVLKELYSSMDNAWFDGVEDPNLTAIKFTPKEAVTWSNDDNKLVTLLKLGTAAITGNNKDIGSKEVVSL